MDYKWIGAILIITACGSFGLSLANAHRREEKSLQSLVSALDYMASELHFHATPLPELCRNAAKFTDRGVDQVFSDLAGVLDKNQTPDVASCMDAVLKGVVLPPIARNNLQILGRSLGQFDLEGQLNGLSAARSAVRQDLEKLSLGRDQRLRNYQTLSVCAGAALVILLI